MFPVSQSRQMVFESSDPESLVRALRRVMVRRLEEKEKVSRVEAKGDCVTFGGRLFPASFGLKLLAAITRGEVRIRQDEGKIIVQYHLSLTHVLIFNLLGIALMGLFAFMSAMVHQAPAAPRVIGVIIVLFFGGYGYGWLLITSEFRLFVKRCIRQAKAELADRT